MKFRPLRATCGHVVSNNSFAPSRLYEKKNRGIVTEKLRDFFRFLELRGVRLNEPGKKPFFLPVRPVQLPADFSQIIRGHFRDLDLKEIKRETGLNQGPAKNY